MLKLINPSQKHRLSQLDSIRAIAVVFVLWEHYASPVIFNAGRVGVAMFFVLSGYLITGILVRLRDDFDNKVPLHNILAVFYARRFLRIVPVYFATLALITWLGMDKTDRGWPWLYGTNFYLIFHPTLGGGAVGLATHFWSLAVEMQFYLVWPFLILLLPRKAWLPLAATAVIAGPISRIVGAKLLDNYFFAWFSPTSCLDTLALGGALAICQYQHKLVSAKWSGPLAFLALLSFLAVISLHLTNRMFTVYIALYDLSIAGIMVFVIHRCSTHTSGNLGKLLENPLLIYLGTISYGVYIFHNFTRHWIEPWLRSFSFPSNAFPPLNFLTNTVVTLIIASLSWHLFEAPINHLKMFIQSPHKSRSENSPR